jgi:hypothetical protein
MNEPMEPLPCFELRLKIFNLKSEKMNDLAVNHYRSKYLALIAPPPEV